MLGIQSIEKYKCLITPQEELTYCYDVTSLTPSNLRIKKRDPAKVDSIVLHQTAVSRKEDNPRHLLTCSHYLVLLNGSIFKLHPHEAYLYSANSFNVRSISIEVAGNFEGNIGKGDWYMPEKFGKDILSTQAVLRLRDLIYVLSRSCDISIKYIFAHRQSGISSKTGKPNRPLDPGEEIWRECGNWAVQSLNLSDGGPGFISKGLPIPDNWRLPPKVIS